jgi:hypothetical protein
MQTVFATRHALRPRLAKPLGDFAADLYVRIHDWIRLNYEQRYSISARLNEIDFKRALPLGHRLDERMDALDNHRIASIHWSHTHEPDPSACWHVDLTIAHDEAVLELTTELRISALDGSIRPLDFDLGQPRILREIIALSRASVGDWPLPDTVETLEAAQVGPWIHETLCSPARTIPAVVISPRAPTDAPIVDPSALRDRLLGVAQVALLKDRWAAYKLTEIVGPDRSCPGGSIRIYWPGFTGDANPLAHRLYLPHLFEHYRNPTRQIGGVLFRLLGEASVLCFSEGPVTRAVRRALAERDRASHDALVKEVRQGHAEQEGLLEALVRAGEQLDQVMSERDDLKEENRRIRADLDALQSLWRRMGPTARPGTQASAGVSHEDSDADETLETVEDACVRARDDFQYCMVLLDSAFASARDSAFRRPKMVYDCLRAIYETTRKWRDHEGRLGTSWEQELAAFGFEFKNNISQTSRTRFASDYTFPYQGRKLLFEQHITLGAKQQDKCLSIHMYRDDERRVMVIGWCGRHRRNTSS